MGNFVDNNQDRCPIALVVDVSSSMREDGMLNTAIETFRDAVLTDPVATLGVEVALVAFNHQTEIRPEFSSINQFDPGFLKAREGARICEGIEPRNRHDRGTQGHLLSQRRGLLAALDVHPHRRHDGRLPRPAGNRRQVQEHRGRQGRDHLAIMSGAAGYDGARSRCDRSPTGPCRWQMREASYAVLLEWMANSTVARSNANASERIRMEDPTAWLKWKPKPKSRMVRRCRQGGGSQAHRGQPAQSGYPAVPDQDALCYRSRPGTDRGVVVVCDGAGRAAEGRIGAPAARRGCPGKLFGIDRKSEPRPVQSPTMHRHDRKANRDPARRNIRNLAAGIGRHAHRIDTSQRTRRVCPSWRRRWRGRRRRRLDADERTTARRARQRDMVHHPGRRHLPQVRKRRDHRSRIASTKPLPNTSGCLK